MQVKCNLLIIMYLKLKQHLQASLFLTSVTCKKAVFSQIFFECVSERRRSRQACKQLNSGYNKPSSTIRELDFLEFKQKKGEEKEERAQNLPSHMYFVTLINVKSSFQSTVTVQS